MNDIKSLIFDWHAPVVASLPTLGSIAPVNPRLPVTSFEHPTIIALVRHTGCPFAQKEVLDLARLSNEPENSQLRVIIVCMSPQTVGEEWFSTQGGKNFADQSRVSLICDPAREVYAYYGIGQLAFFDLWGTRMWNALFKLKSQGIVNTVTGDGSYRWQNSGGFAIARGGEIKWMHVASHAGDTCNYDEAVASL